MTVTTLQHCRICKSESLHDAIDLGEQVITSRFPTYGDFSTQKTPIVLVVCSDCGLLQLKHTVQQSELYEYEYGYRSGISNTMRAHLKQYQEEICSYVTLNEGDTVLDIGSNDSTMLQMYPATVKRIGCDPTGKQFKEYYKQVELIPTYFTRENFQQAYGYRKCKIVSSISMFYDLPDPVQFAKDIYSILENEGIWTCEQSYILTMLKRNSIDTICHEHLEYYGLLQIQEIAKRAGFKILDVKFNDCNGGSFRIYFAKDISKTHKEHTQLIERILQEERTYGHTTVEFYRTFMDKCKEEVNKLKYFIQTVNKNGKEAWVYGASTKGNCLLQFADLDQTHMRYAVERNLKKVGKMTSTGIEIISEETMRNSPPAYLLVLPWHFRDEIIEREKEYLEHGGQLIFPFPHFEIVSHKPRVLITGCDGHIAHYVKQVYTETSLLYGIGRSDQPSNDCIKFTADVCDKNHLETILHILQPNMILHLAGICSSEYAMEYPVQTLETNGMSAAYLCDIIYRNNWTTKFFNASSSEIYKGHVDYEIQENDTNYCHLHPYSIGKITSHTIVDFYRSKYNMPFSNGVIFTTESRKRTGNFLLSKVANHAKTWKTTHQPLELGCLDSYRTIMHASDIATAIQTIVSQEKGDTYLICESYSLHVYKLVEEMYKAFDIIVVRKENQYIDIETGLVVTNIGKSLRGIQTNIRGNCVKLRKLGWEPHMTLRDIINDIKDGCLSK